MIYNHITGKMPVPQNSELELKPIFFGKIAYYLGIDFGTSGARIIVINQQKEIVFEHKVNYHSPFLSIKYWQEILIDLLSTIPLELRSNLRAIAIDATSSTVILCDQFGNALDEAIWYNDNRGKTVINELKKFVPVNHLTLSATSSLAKLYWWYLTQPTIFKQAKYFLHQADYLGFLLHGKLGISDYHNALKLGYDLVELNYPQWLINQPFFDILPQVNTPSNVIDSVTPTISKQLQINPQCVIKAGTTDSIAAFLASEVTQPGEAVTSLGSTLVIKLLSEKKIDDSSYGIYSHRLGNLWVTGGASNTGGAVLKYFFSETELISLSQQINPDIPTNLDYYPLLQPGDRFPVNNPNLPPKLEPRPNNSVIFLQGLLEGIANIEAQGYQLLRELGATPLTKVYTAGGGANNETWRSLRELRLKVPVIKSQQTESAYGSALLSMFDGTNNNCLFPQSTKLKLYP